MGFKDEKKNYEALNNTDGQEIQRFDLFTPTHIQESTDI